MGPVEVDWNHPLSQGLIGAFVASQGFVNVAGQSPPLKPNTETPIGTNAFGPAYIQQTGGAGLYLTAPQNFRLLNQLSVFWKGTCLGSYVGPYNAIIAGVSAASTDTSPYVAYGVINTSTNATGINISGNTAGATTVVAGQNFDVGLSYAPSFNGHFYFDGAYQIYSGGPIGSNSYLSSAQITIGGYLGDLTRSPNVATNCAYFYDFTQDANGSTDPRMPWLHEEPFAMFKPRTVRRYYTVVTTSGNTATISGGIGPIGAGFVATQSQSAAIASTAGPVAAAVTAAQSQSASLAGTLGSVSSAITASQSNPATLAATTGATSAAITASQSQSATIAPHIGPVAAAINASQSQSAVLAASAGSVASAWSITQANIGSIAISATIGPVSAAMAATQSQAATLAASAAPVASAIVAAQSVAMSLTGALGGVSSAITAAQSQAAAASASIGPVASAWQATQTNIATLAINATLGPVSASLIATQSQIAAMQAVIGPVSAAFVLPAWAWGYDTYLTVTIQPISRVVSAAPITRTVAASAIPRAITIPPR